MHLIFTFRESEYKSSNNNENKSHEPIFIVIVFIVINGEKRFKSI